jgi:hypothetical protein
VDVVLLGGGLGAALSFELFPFPSRVSLAGSYTQGPSLVERPVSLEYRALQLGFCPWGVSGARFELYACAVGSVGALHGEGRARAETSAVTRSASAVGASLEAGMHLGSGFWLEASFGIGVPLQERRFVLEGPTEVLAESPVISMSSAVGLGFDSF